MLLAHWQMPDGYYLYRHRFEFAVPPGSAFTLGEAEIPQGKIKNDEYFGEVQVYYHEVSARVPVTRTEGRCGDVRSDDHVSGLRGSWPLLSAENQTCVVSGRVDRRQSRGTPNNASRSDGDGAGKTEEQHLAGLLANGNLLLSLAIFFAAGLGLAFTPCVLPMVPILSSIIVGQGSSVTRGTRLYALVGLCARHGRHVCGARCRRRLVRCEHESAGGFAVAAGADRLRDRVRVARDVDVRFLRAAIAAGVAEPRERDVAEPTRRRARRCSGNGQPVQPGRVAVSLGAARRRADLSEFHG